MPKDKILHVLRNPDGWFEDTIREARLQACNLIEAQDKRLQELATGLTELQQQLEGN